MTDEKPYGSNYVFRNGDLLEFPDGSVRCVTGDPNYRPGIFIPKKPKDSKLEKQAEKA